MAIIQPKKKPVIQKGKGYVYVPETFVRQPNSFVVDDPEEMLELINPYEFHGRHIITFDTETHPHYANSQMLPASVVRRWVGSGKSATPQDYPFCISVCDGVNNYTIYDSVENNFRKFQGLAPLFMNPDIEKIAHNIKYDMHMLANVDMKIRGKLHDTVVLAKLTDENRRSFQLRDLAAHYDKGITLYEYMVDNYKQTHKVKDYRHIPKPLLTEYANADVWNCFLTFTNEYPRLLEDDLLSLYENEMELTVVLYAMERYGMKVDKSYEVPLKQELQNMCDEAERSIYDEAGKVFNVNSGKQLYEVLMNLGVDDSLIGRTEKGNPKLDKNALANLAEVHNVSIVQKILEFRKYDKLLTTYAEGIYSQRDAEDRVHGSINQTEATTGRMSITKPALQTLPKKDKSIRRAFIPDDDCTMWFMDLDQVEYRLFAHYAKATNLLDAIAHGYDVHAATAANLYHKDLHEFVKLVESGDEEASNLRSKAKTVNFALLYGVGISHLSEMLKCSETEAGSMRSQYFASLPEAQVFISTVQQVIKMRGFVKNFYGRRRRLDSNDCYKAPNALIQGCAADYIKHKIVNMYKYLMYHNLETHMTNIVHDEVVINFSNKELDHVPVLRWLMSDFKEFRCPITAGAEYGNPNWGAKVEDSNVGFKEPDDMSFLNYNVYDGAVFDIRRN